MTTLDQIPLFPLWASMVQSSIEFCRIVWDIQYTRPYLVNVLVAGATPIMVNDATRQNIQALEQQFPHAQPRQTHTHDRIQPSIEAALNSFLERGNSLKRCRIVLVTIAKQPNEKAFEQVMYYNNPNDPVRDLRAMVYQAVASVDPSLDHVQIDVLRLLPYVESAEYSIPPKIMSKQLSPRITMSVYNIPNGQDDLKHAMRHLAQLYYNINVLHISNIPMKFHDMATEVYLDMTTKGSISYLVTPEKSHTKTWTHILMAQEGVIFLHCLNSQLQQQFVDAESNAIQLANIKVEGFINAPLDATGNIPKTMELLDTLIRPNVYENVKEYLEASVRNHLCKSVTFDPSRFSHHLPIMHSTAKEKGLCTSRSIEKATRWRTCFRDCEGTDRFPILYENKRPIQDLAIDVLNGIPVSSGFGVAFGLIHDLFEQLQDVILKDVIYAKEIKSTQDLIAMIVTELVSGIQGFGQKLFVKGLRKEDAKLTSKKLLVALCLVGKRFSKDSTQHQQLCSYIHSVIEEKTQFYFQENDTSMQVKPDETTTPTALDVVWSQVNRYENMSLREREDAAHGFLPEFKSEKPILDASVPFKSQLPAKQASAAAPRLNPNFKSRRGGNSIGANNSNIAPSSSVDPRSSYHYNQKRPTYPDPSNAKPYLTYIAPTLEEKAQEEEQEEKSLGNPGNLLWLYWMNDKIKKRGNQDEGDLSLGTELVYKDHQWKRVKKEFLGRLAQPGEKGETT
ncbi:hypothetical protein HMPREF1544_00991 [Mucor circinelloides 1006PhL]|uniref:Uncharacterized protein n=1 Tax=Mucor circinelloides f. circinelloides (strain 1006PhL) TaxID=1220926 RepID=S2JP93_MUCC1|nr:hypothetical protein HMPREF1544_00991 [Mucor circinelloides 1006PhL]